MNGLLRRFGGRLALSRLVCFVIGHEWDKEFSWARFCSNFDEEVCSFCGKRRPRRQFPL